MYDIEREMERLMEAHETEVNFWRETALREISRSAFWMILSIGLCVALVVVAALAR